MINDILIALAVVGAVGLIAGVLLALFAHFFSVAQDEREKKVREALPGANCGACGYKGCDDYAAAVAAGSAAANLCIPGGADTASALSEIMGVEVAPPRDVTAYVHCNGSCEAAPKRNLYDGVATCRAAVGVYGGPNSCLYGCLGYGDCAVACPAGAICVKDGIAHVDPRLCIGCGLCVSNCPKHIISIIDKNSKAAVMCSSHDKGAVARKLCSNACIGCKKCEKTCPEGAISVVGDLARIDYDKCSGCGKCAQVCPTGCLKDLAPDAR